MQTDCAESLMHVDAKLSPPQMTCHDVVGIIMTRYTMHFVVIFHQYEYFRAADCHESRTY